MRRCLRVALGSLLVLSSTSWTLAQVTAELVADVETGPRRGVIGYPDALHGVGGRVVFVRDSPGRGFEPWACCAPDAGPVLLADINPGECSSWALATGAAPLPGGLVFRALDPVEGFGPWYTDGTPTGTRALPDRGFSYPSQFTAVADVVYFVDGSELWRTDGTDPGTHELELPDGAGRLLGASVDRLFLVGANGRELWTSDGTTVGTQRVLEINPVGPATPRAFVGAGDRVYFVADDGVSGDELWVSDGTGPGTRRVLDLVPGPDSPAALRPIAGLGTSLFFEWQTAGGFELWFTDGTDVGSVRLTATHEHVRGAVADGGFYFQGGDETTGTEPWVSDGTPGGTRSLGDLFPGPDGSRPTDFRALGGRVYFLADDAVSGREIWRTDGTAANTRRFVDLNPVGDPGAFGLTVIDGSLYFGADGGRGQGTQLWRSDGTSLGTERLTEGEGSGSSYPELTVDLNGRAVFFATHERSELGLWQSDGIGLELLTDLTDDPYLYDEVAVAGGRVFFTTESSGTGTLWSSDGTPGGTGPVADLGDDWNGPWRALTGTDDLVFFLNDDGVNGRELWRSDGTDAGTFLVRDVAPGDEWLNIPNYDGVVTDIVGRGDRLFFMGPSPGLGSGSELWVSGGTEASTLALSDFTSVGGAAEGSLAVLNETVYFLGRDEAGRELWQSDGSPEGTRRAFDLRAGADGSNPRLPTATTTHLFFLADDGIFGEEPWRSDGTLEGTVRVADLEPGPRSSMVEQLRAVGRGVFLVHADPDLGDRLWVVGADESREVREPPGPPAFSRYEDLVAVRERLFFVADDGEGSRLMMTDGTPEGTLRVEGPTLDASCPGFTELTAVGERLHFAVNDPAFGEEPWVVEARHGLIVNDRIEDLGEASRRLRAPDVLGAPRNNVLTCGRTRLAEDERLHATLRELEAGVALPETDGALVLVELVEWCSASGDPAESPPLGPQEARPQLVVTKVDDVPVVRLRP